MSVPEGGTAAGSGTALPGATVDLLVGLLLLWGVTAATSWVIAVPATFLSLVFALYGVLALLILARAAAAVHPSIRARTLRERIRIGLGPANRVTLARATLVVPVAGLAVVPASPGEVGLWWVILLSSMALLLDGVDGRVARETGTETAFGARFDMELDAFLMLTLSILVWAVGKVGPWVIGIGALRYGFVAAGFLLPRLRTELPPSYRRKAVCVVQGVALLVCLGPIIPGMIATAVAAAALALLVYSFAVDTRWLLADASPSVHGPRTAK